MQFFVEISHDDIRRLTQHLYRHGGCLVKDMFEGTPVSLSLVFINIGGDIRFVAYDCVTRTQLADHALLELLKKLNFVQVWALSKYILELPTDEWQVMYGPAA